MASSNGGNPSQAFFNNFRTYDKLASPTRNQSNSPDRGSNSPKRSQDFLIDAQRTITNNNAKKQLKILSSY